MPSLLTGIMEIEPCIRWVVYIDGRRAATGYNGYAVYDTSPHSESFVTLYSLM